MNETALGKRICLLASELGHRIFRCNRGEAWIGKAIYFSKPARVEVEPGDVLIRKAKRFHAGLVNGQGDYIGYSPTGRFISVELKTEKGVVSEEQINWMNAVNGSGGIAGICRSEEDAFELLS